MKIKPYYLAEGKQGRTIIARLKPGQELIDGIATICKEKKIRAAYLPVIIGGFSQLKIVSMKPAKTPEGIVSIPKLFEEPVEYFGQGTIATVKNKPSLHIHLTAARSKNVAIAGHLESGMITLVTELVIVELKGVKITRHPDQEVFDYPLLTFHR